MKKDLELFSELAEEKENYKKFYEVFSKCWKLRMHVYSINHQSISEPFHCHTSLSGDEMTSLSDYVSHVKKTQKSICYIIGESKGGQHCILEHVQKQFEVVYITEPIKE